MKASELAKLKNAEVGTRIELTRELSVKKTTTTKYDFYWQKQFVGECETKDGYYQLVTTDDFGWDIEELQAATAVMDALNKETR